MKIEFFKSDGVRNNWFGTSRVITPFIAIDYMYQFNIEIEIEDQNADYTNCTCCVTTDDNYQIYSGIVEKQETGKIYIQSFLKRLNAYIFSGLYKTQTTPQPTYLESMLVTSLNNYYKTNIDTKQNIPFITFNALTSTTGQIDFYTDSGDLIKLCEFLFKKYLITVTFTLNQNSGEIICEIGKKGINSYSLKEGDGIEFVKNKVDETSPNKVYYHNKADTGMLLATYVLLKDGNVTTDLNHNLRYDTVRFVRNVVDNNTDLLEMAKQDLQPTIYNQEIILNIPSTLSFFDPSLLRLGDILNLYDKYGNLRKTIITGIQIDYENKLYTIKCGFIRNRLSYKLKNGGI